MNKEEIKEELGILKLAVPKSCKNIINLAQQYLAVAGKMPEKHDSNRYDKGSNSRKYQEGYNQAINYCTLATVGMLLSSKSIIKKYNELIMSVGNKYKNETRHQTALRYIKQAEEVNELSSCKAI